MLDARERPATHCLTLTTWSPSTSPAAIRRGTENVIRRLRRRFGAIEYFAAVEFTTGKAASSGGHRRLHLHLLLKVDEHERFDVIEAERLTRDTWRGSTGAFVVEVAALVSPGAALGYLALHHRKPEQAPPSEWRGMTERSSRGYFGRPIAELREQARTELRAEAIAWAKNLPLEVAALELAARPEPRVVRVREATSARLLIEPLGELSAPVRRVAGRLVDPETGELALDLRTLPTSLPGDRARAPRRARVDRTGEPDRGAVHPATATGAARRAEARPGPGATR